jgi:hypothetical protein
MEVFSSIHNLRMHHAMVTRDPGTHQLLVYADDINFLSNSVNTKKEKTETLLKASRDVGLEINAQKTKYMMSRHLNSGENPNIRIANESFESKAKLSLCLTKHHAMRAYWGSGGIAPVSGIMPWSLYLQGKHP